MHVPYLLVVQNLRQRPLHERFLGFSGFFFCRRHGEQRKRKSRLRGAESPVWTKQTHLLRVLTAIAPIEAAVSFCSALPFERARTATKDSFRNRNCRHDQMHTQDLCIIRRIFFVVDAIGLNVHGQRLHFNLDRLLSQARPWHANVKRVNCPVQANK